MKISVIVPYHGEEVYLSECLESLKEQTFKGFEVILVATGVDIPEEVIKKYDMLDIKSYRIDDNKVSVARNYGLKMAEGEYIAYVDCDDYLYEDFFEKMMACSQNKGEDVSFGRLCYTWYSRHIHLSQEVTVNEKNDDEASKDNSEEKDGADEEELYYHDYIEEGDSEEVIHRKRVDMAEHYLVSKRKNLQSITALGNIYRKDYLIENNIAFNEELDYMTDLAYIAAVINADGRFNGDKSAVYVKRKHNDPIHMPSLTQKNSEDFDYVYRAYCDVIKNTKPDSELKARYDRKLLGYLASTVAPAIRTKNDGKWKRAYSKQFSELLTSISDDVYKDTTAYKRKLAVALMAGNLARVAKLARNKNYRNMLAYAVKNPRFITKAKDIMYRKRYAKQPVMDNVVLFESFFGKSYSDSPKYIFEKLNEMYPGKYECVWILEKKTELPYPAKQIKRFSFAYYKYLARAKYIVFNSRQPKNFIKRKENVFLETWHGTPLKKLVYDMDEVVSASPLYKRNFYIQSRSWDYLVAANSFSDEVFKRAFDYDKPMLKYGYPRNDILHRPDKDKIAADIKKKIGIPEDKKIILYAPTWRDDEFYEAGKYKFTLKLDLEKMRRELGDEYVVILRTHYFIADKIDVTGMEDFVYNLSKYDDIAELYLISDILITDYSSVFFDFANLKRPILYFTYDLDKYRDVLRGFYIDMEKDIPGPLVFTTDEIIDSVKNIEAVSEKYADVYDTFYERFCGWEDGHASENCIKEVFK